MRSEKEIRKELAHMEQLLYSRSSKGMFSEMASYKDALEWVLT